jgi:dipeptidyl aminopeptidase/acylaminoacyl peptidase
LKQTTKRIFVLFTVFLMVSVLSAAEKRPFSIADLYKLKSVGSLDLSPDGKKLLFTVNETNLEKATSNTDIYMMDMATRQISRLTYKPAADFHPFFSPDGASIYFTSTRKEGTQLWEMKTAGGEARKISAFHTGISNAVITKQHDLVYFTSDVYPECLADCACNEKKGKQLSEGPVQAHMSDTLLYRHWASYRDWTYTHLFALDLKDKDGKIKAFTEGSVDYPAFSLGGAGFAVSPNGKEICITSNHDKFPANSTNTDLFLIEKEAETFAPLNITETNKGADTSPAYSPNGAYIAFTRQMVPGYESDKVRLALYNRSTKQTEILTEAIDNWVDSFVWSPDSRYIYFTVQEKGRAPLYRIHLKTKKIGKVLEGHAIREFVLTPDGKSIIFTRSSVGEPVEIWSYRIGKKSSLKQLSFINKKVADEVEIRPAEELWVEGAGGKKIHVFVVKPHGFDPSKKYPLIINVHGGPQMQWSDSFRGDWQVYPGAGYVVAFPNPHGSTGYGQEFTAAISKDWNGKVIEDVEKVTDYLAGLDYIDEERIGAMGWSWGGYAMMWLEGNSTKYKALAAMMGVYDLDSMYGATEELWFPQWDLGGTPWDKPESYRVQSPSSYVKNFKTPCLVITGELDYRVPYTQSLQFFTGLQKMGVDSRLIVFKHDGHWPNYVKSMPVYYNAHLEWFHKYLKGGAAPYDTEKLIRNSQFTDEKEEAKKEEKDK